MIRPFLRLHFAAGFFGVQQYQTDYHQLIEIEAQGFNSASSPSRTSSCLILKQCDQGTLAPYDQCPNANNAVSAIGNNFTTKWASIYLADAQKRLAPHVQGFALNATWLFAMQQTCAYEVRFISRGGMCAEGVNSDCCAGILCFL